MSVSSALKLVSSNKVFGGLQQVYEHASNELKCNMKFAVYLPHTAQKKAFTRCDLAFRIDM